MIQRLKGTSNCREAKGMSGELFLALGKVTMVRRDGDETPDRRPEPPASCHGVLHSRAVKVCDCQHSDRASGLLRNAGRRTPWESNRAMSALYVAPDRPRHFSGRATRSVSPGRHETAETDMKGPYPALTNPRTIMPQVRSNDPMSVSRAGKYGTTKAVPLKTRRRGSSPSAKATAPTPTSARTLDRNIQRRHNHLPGRILRPGRTRSPRTNWKHSSRSSNFGRNSTKITSFSAKIILARLQRGATIEPGRLTAERQEITQCKPTLDELERLYGGDFVLDLRERITPSRQVHLKVREFQEPESCRVEA